MVRRFVSTKTLTFTPQEGTMTHGKKSKTVSPGLKSLVQEDRDLMKELVREALQSFLEAEMTEFLGASSGERTDERKGYRAGYYRRSWITRVGKVELAVPRDRSGQIAPGITTNRLHPEDMRKRDLFRSLEENGRLPIGSGSWRSGDTEGASPQNPETGGDN